MTTQSEQMVARLWTPEQVSKLPRDHRDAHSNAMRVRAHEELMELHHRSAANSVMDAEDYGVYMVSGLRRQGKTLFATGWAEVYFGAGRVVFSNLGLTFGYRIEAMDLYLLATRVPRRSVVVVDEIHTLLSRYSQNARRERELISALAGVGKREVLVIGITQQEEMVSHDFMRELDGLIYVRSRRRAADAYPPWCWVQAATLGPRPLAGRTIAEREYDFNLAPQKKAFRKYPVSPTAMWEASKHVYSWADVPFGSATGNAISASDMRTAVAEAEEIVFDAQPGEDEADAQALAEQAWRERANLWVTYVVNVFAAYGKVGSPLEDSRYNVKTLATMVHDYYGTVMANNGIAHFTDKEASDFSSRTMNAQNGYVRVKSLVEKYPELKEWYG
ncbi:MAG: AAA family ATPase [Gammaproteobacteria bacterium]|nr:AAA family ATPase [Gammaproteobacteria bacterium]